MKDPRDHRLQLTDYETRKSHFAIYRASEVEFAVISSDSALLLRPESQQVWIWNDLRVGDLVIVASLGPSGLRLGAFRFTGKFIERNESKANQFGPLGIYLHRVGTGRLQSVPWEAAFGKTILGMPSRMAFQELWESCDSAVEGLSSRDRVQVVEGYDIKVADSHEDFAYVERASAFHTFGYRQGTITLVALRGIKYEGAAVVEYSQRITIGHRAAIRIFRADFERLKRNALCILRLYSMRPLTEKLRVHRALLQAIVEVAPSLVSAPLSYIEGVSYDYHPVARRLGFFIVPPSRIEDTFYYYKAFSVPAHVPVTQDTQLLSKTTHKILLERKGKKCWIARGRREDIASAVDRAAWAVSRSRENTKMWHALMTGHIVFLLSYEDRILAYGEVHGREIRSVKGLERYPLWIDFAKVTKGIELNVKERLTGQWYADLSGLALKLLPDELGATLKAEADALSAEGKMWVRPNPYLLHQTEFTVVPNQVFVILPWDLRKTVYPVISSILQENGYTAVFAGDRDGQVVFGDIWLMLNESEEVIVDFTLRRPNVYLEFGMALVLGKPIVAITQDLGDIPSDTQNVKVIPYSDRLNDTALKLQLPRALRDTAADIARAVQFSNVR